MLTGDGVDVAIAVARRRQIIAELDRVALLDYDHDSERLVWKELGSRDGASRDRGFQLAKS